MMQICVSNLSMNFLDMTITLSELQFETKLLSYVVILEMVRNCICLYISYGGTFSNPT